MVQKSCRVEVVLLSGGCCFFSPDFFEAEIIAVKKYDLPGKLTWQWKTQPFEDVPPIKKKWCSILMLVFRVVVVWRFFWKNQTEKKTKKTLLFQRILAISIQLSQMK